MSTETREENTGCERVTGERNEGRERERDVEGWVEAEGRTGSMSKSSQRETEM